MLVLDGLINELLSRPVEAKITGTEGDRIKFSWTLSGVPTKDLSIGGRTKETWRFKAVFIKKTKRLVVRSSTQGEVYPSASGTCKLAAKG